MNSNHITVHQASEEEEESNEERRTASLGDLSKLEMSTCANSNRPSNGTLERAQSLEMSDANNQMAAGKVVPKKRKAQACGDLVEVMELKEPRYSEPIIENMEPLQTVRLKSSYEWGNLEDAIYDGKDKNASDESFEMDSPQKKLSSSSMDMMSEVLAAADKFDKEINDIELNEVMNEIAKVDFEITTSEPVNGIDEPIRVELGNNDEFEMKISPEPVAEVENKMMNNGVVVDGVNENDDEMIDQEIQQNITQIQLPTAAIHVEVKSGDGFDEIVIDQPQNIVGTNASDDAKATRYPLTTLERPKSEVLKQLIAQHIPGESDDQSMEVNGISYPKSTSSDGPINITVAGHSESDASESNQMSPVFSSDGSGVNNISISSTESDATTNELKNSKTPSPTLSTMENRITISNNDSQPASIVIEDETLNFKMQTLDDEPMEQQENKSASNKSSPNQSPKSKHEVFIVESLSSKKMHESSLPVSNGKDSKPPAKGFVTEIRFPSANKDKQMNAKNLSKSMENQRNHSSPDAKHKSDSKGSSPNEHRKGTEKPVIVEEEYIPRNNEIRFTTSTYQSPRQIEKRHSQIDQIRSNFERSHTSEFSGIPIRKISTPSTPPPHQSSNVARVSPSKIPVFTSQKSSDNLLKNSNNGNRVSVSVTSIKNSSRNPSGK